MIRMLILGALGYAGYKYYEKNSGSSPAFAGNQGDARVRDSGPGAMRDAPSRSWTKTDEESDQSFPASDPPANY